MRFLLLLLGVLLCVFGVHITVLFLMDFPPFGNKIILSYVANYLLAGLLLLLIQSNINKQSSNTAFIFMIGSVVKFVLFFVFILPTYKEDDIVETSEFIAFFVPYATCLLLEVIFLSKQLNNQNDS